MQPKVLLTENREDIADVCDFARQMSTGEFVDDKKAAKIKKAINTMIRNGAELDDFAISVFVDCDINLVRLWKLVATIKADLFLFIHSTDDIECSICGHETFHEGYVITNKYGMFMEHREEFSYANFNVQGVGPDKSTTSKVSQLYE